MNKQQIQQAFNTFRNRMKAERGPNPDFSHLEAFKAGIEAAQLASAAPVADDAKDAARYRWLRERGGGSWSHLLPSGNYEKAKNETFDAVIDKEMQAT